ncbi:hypothetical protein IH824_18835 [candidate division KSB1 bacterium]|nr:hypothetical protein [candidate division KSB1 bacterium]
MELGDAVSTRHRASALFTDTCGGGIDKGDTVRRPTTYLAPTLVSSTVQRALHCRP